MIIIKSLGHSDQKWGIATSRLGIATRFGAFRSWGIPAVGHCDYNSSDVSLTPTVTVSVSDSVKWAKT